VAQSWRVFDRFLLGLGALDLAAGCQALVAQHAQDFDFGALAATFAVLEDLELARAGHAVFIDRFFFFGLGAPQHQQFADVLDGRGVQFGGQFW
jgi:hypothetical protein